MNTPIKGFPNYIVYASGDVKNITTGKFKTKRIIRGYYYIDLSKGTERRNWRLGRMVAEHFIPNPKRLPQVNHIDGNCLNDDVNNLEWVSVHENQLKKNILRRKKGTYERPRGNRKFTDKTILKVREMREGGLIHKDIAKKLKMGVSTVTHILLGSRRNNQLLSCKSDSKQNTL